MYVSDLVRRSGRSLRSAKLRTFLTSMAIGVGAFTLSLTLAASNGLHDYTTKLIKNNFDPAELIVGRDKEIENNTAGPSDVPQEYDESITSMSVGAQNSVQIKRITEAEAEELRKLPYVTQVREDYQVSIRYVTREGQKKYTGGIQAYNPSQKPELKAGELPAKGDIKEGEVLLPESYISVLGFKDAADAVGKTIDVVVQQPFSLGSLQSLLSQGKDATLGDLSEQVATQAQVKTQTLRIAAVSKKTATSLSVGVLPLRISSRDARALYDYTAAGTSDYNKFIYVSVGIKDGTDDAKLLAAQKDLKAKGYYLQSSKDIQKAITQFVDILTIMVGVFGMITVIASVFGIVNTQYISVLERTREIGLMKALGLSRGKISQLFMLEATWIGFLGGLIGSVLGIVTGLLVNPFLTDKLDLGEGNNLLIFRPVQLVLLVVALMLVATVAGLFPSRKAAKLDPIEALRTE